jgi:hypothetical protein
MSPQVKPAKVGGRKLEEIRDTDPDGRPVLHSQVIDPLTRMLREGRVGLWLTDPAGTCLCLWPDSLGAIWISEACADVAGCSRCFAPGVARRSP